MQGQGNQMNARGAAPKLVNFCQVPLTKQAECSAVCADDCEVENLLTGSSVSTSSFLQRKPRGLRVEHFVRPPVHLDFSFLAPIDVVCVVVKPALSGEDSAVTLTVSATSSGQHRRQEDLILMGRGSLKGHGAVLLMINRVFERRHDCKVDLRSFPCVQGTRVTSADTAREPVEVTLKELCNVRHLRLTVSYLSGPRPVSLELVEVWGKLGVCTSKEDSQKALAALATLEKKVSPAVATPRDGAAAVLMYKASSRPCPEGGLADCHLCQKSIYHSSCPFGGTLGGQSVKAAAFSLTVRGKEDRERTQNYTTPCRSDRRKLCDCSPAPGQSVLSLAALGGEEREVGEGCPAQGSCRELNFSGHLHSSGANSGARQSSGCHGTRRNSERGGGETMAISVPERFLDEITCEVMVLPMLLPSGHYVDRSTLDKLHATDCVYGRPPSDPFTGVPFSEHAEPQFSVEFKQQIDNFISRHGSQVFGDPSTNFSSVGQTLGSAREIALHLSSTKPSGAGRKRGRDVSDGASLLPLPPQTKRLAIGSTPPERGASVNLKEKRISTAPPISSSPVSGEDCSTTAQRHQEITRVGAGKTLQSHELELASSLDRELQDLFPSPISP